MSYSFGGVKWALNVWVSEFVFPCLVLFWLIFFWEVYGEDYTLNTNVVWLVLSGYELTGLARGGEQLAKLKRNYAKAVELLVELASLQVSFWNGGFCTIVPTFYY